MLLPSALPCDIMAVAAMRPQRPKLLSLGAYVPQPQDSYAGGLFASCRALHSILGNPQLPPSQPHDTAAAVVKPALSANSCVSKRLQSPPRLVLLPRGLNKRRRSIFEEDQYEKENIPHTPEDRDLYQTPKRRRRVPLDIPPGLNVADFANLGTPAPTPRKERDEDVLMPPLTEEEDGDDNTDCVMRRVPAKIQSPIQTRSRRKSETQFSKTSNNAQPPDPGLDADGHPLAQEQWSPLDDRKLVEVVLSKLNLSKRDWNDCAKQLGKDKDSLGRRWKMLIGEGNVGLRRGLGRHERGDLDITSW